MAGNHKSDLVAALRSRLSDDRASVPAFALQVTGRCRSAVLEISNGYLTVTVEGGEDVSSVRWSLSAPNYCTVGRLLAAFRAQRGYQVTPDTAVNEGFSSMNLQVEGFPDISNRNVYQFKHHIFSNDELTRFLEDAVSTHNPNYTVSRVPESERVYVLYKAQAAAYRALAADAARRKGIDTEASVLLSLAQDLEAQYEKDRERMMRVIPVAKAEESAIGQGDVIQGTFSRFSLRGGYLAPKRAAIPPPPPVLYAPADNDVEDILVRLRWKATRDAYFVRYELWRDTQGTVERSSAGRSQDPGLPLNTSWSKAGTARLVHDGNLGQTSRFDGFVFDTFAERGGGSTLTNHSFVDGLAENDPLETETVYYYRLYVVNINGEVLPSDVIKVQTKKRRAFLKRQGKDLAPDAISPVSGLLAGGTVVTLLGYNFEAGMRVELNGKPCSVTIVSPNEVTIVIPGQSNEAFRNLPLDLTVISLNGLKDFARAVWRYV